MKKKWHSSSVGEKKLKKKEKKTTRSKPEAPAPSKDAKGHR